MPKAVSVWPTAVLSLGSLSKPHVSARSPQQHWQALVSDWGVKGCGTDHLYKSCSVLPSMDQLRHFPLIVLRALPVFQLISLPERGLSQVWWPLLSFSSPPTGAGPILAPLFSSFSLFCPTHYAGIFSHPFWCLRSSASVQQVLCASCSTCRCILDVLVGRGEPQTLLFCHLNPLSLYPLNLMISSWMSWW